jgi:very-short-patch-repair endonuclease
LIADQKGVLTTGQAMRFLAPGVIRGHLGRRRWRRLCWGVLLAENGRLMPDQQLWAAVLAAGGGARLGGRAAAIEGGVQGLRHGTIDVLVPIGRGRSGRLPGFPADMPAVRIHRTSILPRSHQQAGRPPRTTVARAVIDAAGWAESDNEARDVITRACQQNRATVTELRDVLGRFPTIRRRRLIVTTIADAEGGAAALSEIDFVRLCRRYRLPAPDLQRRRLDESGRNRYVDAEWSAFRVVVEVDGGYHMDVQHWAADMLRQNQIWIAGDRILRFPAWVVRADPATVAQQIRAALTAGGLPAPRKPVRAAQPCP